MAITTNKQHTNVSLKNSSAVDIEQKMNRIVVTERISIAPLLKSCLVWQGVDALRDNFRNVNLL